MENVLAEAPSGRRGELLREFCSAWRLGEYSQAIDERLHRSVCDMSRAEKEEILRDLLTPGQTIESLLKHCGRSEDHRAAARRGLGTRFRH
jgi:hypothetical protein